MSNSLIINHEYLNQLEESIINSEAYKRKFKEAKASFEKNKEILKKAGIINK